MNAYNELIEQYADDAAFLWVLRSIAVEQPHYHRQEMLELEKRIEKKLNGLFIAPDDAWQACLSGLELEQPGEVFIATVVAFKSHDMEKIQQAVHVGLSNNEAEKGLISALGWLPSNLVQPWIKKLFTSKDLNHKYLALASCSVRRENPSKYLTRILERDDCKQQIKLYARALRLIGELRRQDLMPQLSAAVEHDNQDIRFWAIWSAILLGNHQQVSQLESYVLTANANRQHAVNIAFRVLPIEQARHWISTLSNDPAQSRIVIQAVGVLGDPHAVNWLITQMKEKDTARLAAQSFTFITGIDLLDHALMAEDSEPIIESANDNTDKQSILQDDNNLPWPDHTKISKLWMNKGSGFITGQRYFLGESLSEANLQNSLRDGGQRQRHAAALELSLTHNEMPMQNTRCKIAV